MKTLITTLLLFNISVAFSQQKLVSIVEAERSFARYAIDHNTKEAFLKFMDTGAVVFNNGEILKAKQVWENKKPNKAKLIWDPAFVVISTAGDMGISTGPWKFKPEGKDSVIANGEFTTVWLKKDTAWRWVVDMGIDHPQNTFSARDLNGIELGHLERTTYDAGRYMLMAEQNFINSYTTNGKEAYNEVADKDIHFNTNGYVPVHGSENIDEALVNLSGGMKFQAIGSGVSKDGDLGYVYGYVSEKDKKGNYLRVWRRIGRKWMLLLQTLTI